ncbi:MAG: o-succinylbenzoate synthase [Candidatus Nanohaloarchaea archaeon]
MEFEKIEVRRVELPLKEPFETSFGVIKKRNLAVLAAKKDGRYFYGEASAQFAPLYNHETTSSDLDFIKRFVVPALKEVESIEEYNRKMDAYRGNPLAKAAGEFLLHHRKSVEEEKPLKELLGVERTYAECGASVGLQESPEALVEKVRKFREQGFRRAKIKIKPGKDVEYIRAVREEFPGFELMADANSAYTLEDTETLQELDEFDLTMIEQPLSHRDVIDHAKLAEKMETPICLDESIRSAEDVRKAAELGACEVVNLKPQRVGGIREAMKIDSLCRKNGIETWIGGHLESGIGASFAIVASGLPSVAFPNDIAPSQRYFDEDILEDEIEMEDGRIKIPEEPGLYSEVDREKLEKYTTEKKVF